MPVPGSGKTYAVSRSSVVGLRPEPEKEEEAKLGHSIRDVYTIKNQE